jgi:hypothetical protein
VVRDFREESALVDRHALDLCHKLLLALRRADRDHPALRTADAAVAACASAGDVLLKAVGK